MLPELGETENGNDMLVKLHFYNELGKGDWFVMEGSQTEEGIIFYGLVDLFVPELGYFSLSELEDVGCIVFDDLWEECCLGEII